MIAFTILQQFGVVEQYIWFTIAVWVPFLLPPAPLLCRHLPSPDAEPGLPQSNSSRRKIRGKRGQCEFYVKDGASAEFGYLGKWGRVGSLSCCLIWEKIGRQCRGCWGSSGAKQFFNPPGDNCTVRIEKYMKKARRCSKMSLVPLQNNVVYTCRFCSYRNVVVGAGKGHVKELLTSRAKASETECLDSIESKSSSWEDAKTKRSCNNREGNVEPSVGQKTVLEVPDYIPVTPPGILLEKKQKMDQSGFSKPGNSRRSSTTTDAGKGTSGSTKRRRKGWTSLKEIVESNERASKFSVSNFVIPFKL